MHTEDGTVNNGGDGQIVECVGYHLPNVRIAKFAQTFVVKAVRLRNLPTLMISAKESHFVRIAHFESKKKKYCFYAVEAAVDVVPEEDVVAGDLAVAIHPALAAGEELDQVVELTVDVAADGDWKVHALDVGLVHEKLSDLIAERNDLVLSDKFALPKTFDPSIYI